MRLELSFLDFLLFYYSIFIAILKKQYPDMPY